MYKKAWLKIMSALFLINLKKTFKASINKYADMGSHWRAPLSKLKYGVATHF